MKLLQITENLSSQTDGFISGLLWMLHNWEKLPKAAGG